MDFLEQPPIREWSEEQERPVSGPIRCVKRNPSARPPASPPPVTVLPPTDRATFVPPQELLETARHFRAGDYRGCVEPIEALFFARRNTFHQGLLQYVVALLQLRLGLIRTPRKLLAQALAFWEPYPAWQEGVDLAALRAHATALRERLPAEVDQTSPEQAANWWLPPPSLCLEEAPLPEPVV